MYQLAIKLLLGLMTMLCVSGVNDVWAAAPDDVILNANGGSDANNGLKIYIHRGSQMQIVKPNSNGQIKGQVYNQDALPTSSNGRNVLDNGIYIRANTVLYGPGHFGFASNGVANPNSYSSTGALAVTPATVAAGQVQQTTSKFSLPNSSTLVSGPDVTVVWKYTYPLSYVTAEVTVNIPLLYPVSSTNPVRYYHAIDTFLGGSDNGCGFKLDPDDNGRLVVGAYPVQNGKCPTNTGLPTGLDIVESFRERSGKFSSYCVGDWYKFWLYDNAYGCAIGKKDKLSGSVLASNIDTGVAIEYDFTSAGVYTFSYDFVIGSTFVPDYDHFEIRHPGSSTLCPADVQVLACLSSTVPCPSNQIVGSGSLSGNLTFNPTSPSVTQSPNPFVLNEDNPIATVSLQGTGAGTFTLGVTGLIKSPLNGVKCVNTSSGAQSCSFTITNTPCVSTFECMENTLTYNNAGRNPLYTKVLGKEFDVDVVALLANGAQSSGYNSLTGLTVDLVVESANTCSTNLTDIVATKQVSFAASDNGRKKITFSVADALLGGYPKQSYPNLRCRVRDIGLGKTGCSSDNFAIRPPSLSVSSTNTNLALSSPSPTATYTRRAGTDSFNLKVVASDSGYNGTPVINATKFYQHDGLVTVGQIIFDNDSANLNKFPAAIGGTSNSDTFKYSEIGFFQFGAQGVYDDTFAAVDKANGDCDAGGFDNNGSGTPKRYGCSFGNTNASSFFGRFIPDRFEITTGSSVQACSTFVYYGQDSSTTSGIVAPFTIYAKNGSGGITTYYAGTSGYAKFNPSAWANFNFTTSPALVGGATLDHSVYSPYLQGSWSAGQASMVARFNVARTVGPIAEQSFAVTTRVQDSDNVATTPANIALTSATYRYGRLAITPVHGSELLPLTVPLEAQFWGGTGYKRSTEDGCTTFNISTIAMRNYKGNLNACETVLSGSTTMVKGKMDLRLSAPGVSGSTPNTGSVDLDLNFGSAGGDQTCVGPGATQTNAIAGTAGMSSWFGADPVGRATFGIYKAPIIYMRENF